MRTAVMLAMLVALTGCNPPQSHTTPDGRACVPIGYSWRPVWVDPADSGRAC